MQKYFTEYVEGETNTAQLNLANSAEIARTLSIPITSLENEKVHNFVNGTFNDRKDKVTLTICKYFTYLDIECNEYKNIDDYFNYLVDYLSEFKKKEPLLKINRIGVRKRCGENFVTAEEGKKYFEAFVFDSNVPEELSGQRKRSESLSLLTNADNTIKTNYKYATRYADDKSVAVVLDIDTYVDNQFLQSIQIFDCLRKTLDDINNYQFELFKSAATLNHLTNQDSHE